MKPKIERIPHRFKCQNCFAFAHPSVVIPSRPPPAKQEIFPLGNCWATAHSIRHKSVIVHHHVLQVKNTGATPTTFDSSDFSAAAAAATMSGFDHTVGSSAFLFCNWFKHMKMYKIVGLILLCLFVVPIVTHYYLLNVSVGAVSLTLQHNKPPPTVQVENDVAEPNVHRSRSQLDAYEDFSSLKASDLKLRIDEMLRIKVSTKNQIE